MTVDEEGVAGLVVRKSDRCAFLAEGKRVVLTPILESYFSIGSGADYARAAMALGKTAAEAVAVAARFDLYTGFGVDTLRLRAR